MFEKIHPSKKVRQFKKELDRAVKAFKITKKQLKKAEDTKNGELAGYHTDLEKGLLSPETAALAYRGYEEKKDTYNKLKEIHEKNENDMIIKEINIEDAKKRFWEKLFNPFRNL